MGTWCVLKGLLINSLYTIPIKKKTHEAATTKPSWFPNDIRIGLLCLSLSHFEYIYFSIGLPCVCVHLAGSCMGQRRLKNFRFFVVVVGVDGFLCRLKWIILINIAVLS